MNFRIVLQSYLLCLVFFDEAFGSNVDRILGGKNGEIVDYPYQVSLRTMGRHTCGGSIIDESHILTAAHCVAHFQAGNYHLLAVYSGTNLSYGRTGERHAVQEIYVHPHYQGKSTSYYHDIAIIKLARKIRFGKNQNKIDLPSRDVLRGELAVATGWGLINYPSDQTSRILQNAEMTIIPGRACTAYFQGFNVILQEQVCALQKEGVGVCSGDSGGPLTVGTRLVGITSWVIPCGRGFPDVFTNVFAYKSWIDEILHKSETQYVI